MKKYLQVLADDIDSITTHIEEGADDYQEQFIGVVYKHLRNYENHAEGTLPKLLKDMRKAIK